MRGFQGEWKPIFHKVWPANFPRFLASFFIAFKALQRVRHEVRLDRKVFVDQVPIQEAQGVAEGNRIVGFRAIRDEKSRKTMRYSITN